jgi:hypothetical protein
MKFNEDERSLAGPELMVDLFGTGGGGGDVT